MGGCTSRSDPYSSKQHPPADRESHVGERAVAHHGGHHPKALKRVALDPLFDVAAVGELSQFCIAGDDGNITLYNWEEPGTVDTWHAHDRSVNRLAWGRTSNLLASCSRDTTVKLWSLGKHEPVAVLAGHSLTVSAVDFSADNTQVASGSRDTSVRVWDVATGKEVCRNSIQLNVVTDVKWLLGPLATVVAQASEDLNVKLWDTRTPGLLKCTSKLDGYIYFPLCVDVSADGNFLLTSSKGFNNVGAEARLWDLRTMTEVCQYTGHEFDTVACVFLPPNTDGRQRIATASKDSTIRIWDQVSGECLVRYQDNSAGSYSGLTILPEFGGDVILAATTITAGVFVYKLDETSGKLHCLAKCDPPGSV